MDAIRKASGFLFYVVGSLLIVVIMLAKRGILTDAAAPYVHSLDLPVLLVAMLYGGSSLYVSLSRGKKSLLLLLIIFVPLGVLFSLFCWFNFVMPFPTF
jgi:hypothetical protein